MKSNTIKIDEIEYIRADSVQPVKERKGAWTIGEQYLIRTVTMIQTGRLVYIDEHELVLEDAAWIADTGQFSDALKTGSFDEIEPFEFEVIIGRGSIVDASPFKNKLPRSKK
jgi:hypothetical protein